MIVILSGVSGAGKDTIKRILMGKDGRIKTLPSYTTRDKRINEVEGENYYYVSKEKFKEIGIMFLEENIPTVELIKL